MGRGALQQRRLSAEEYAFRRKLFRRRAAAGGSHGAAADFRRNAAKGVVPELTPLERWEISQPGNVLRVFERGGGKKGEIGNPDREEESGRPDDKLGERGFGTVLRTDPVFLGLQKTRLLDPLLSLPGTNDQPGDYRGQRLHRMPRGLRQRSLAAAFRAVRSVRQSRRKRDHRSDDPRRTSPAIPFATHSRARFLPASAWFAMSIPARTWRPLISATPGGTTKPTARRCIRGEQHNPTEEERYQVSLRNPEGAAPRGLWSDSEISRKGGQPGIQREARPTRSSPIFTATAGFSARFTSATARAICSTPKIKSSIPAISDKFEKAVHLADIHLEKGMQCVDCHFEQDSHGNGKLYAEPRAAIELDCVDCHGTIDARATLITSGPASPAGGTHLDVLRTPWNARRFEWRDGKLFQRSMVEPDKEWEVVQTLDTITPGNAHYSEKSRWAKTIRTDGKSWGDVSERFCAVRARQ